MTVTRSLLDFAGEKLDKSRIRRMKMIRTVLSSQTALFVAGIAAGLALSWLTRHPQEVTVPVLRPAGQIESLADNVLVVYSFFEGDETSWGNLEFFVQQGVQPDDGAQYVFVLNGLSSLSDPRLPRLPPNARYVLHENECYDWGTYAWVFDQVQDPKDFQCTTHTCSVYSSTPGGYSHVLIGLGMYADIIFINSSVRGPITMSPAHHWTRLFTERINERVKLVGPAISCEHFCLMEQGAKGLERKGCRKNAHVQSVAIGMDQVPFTCCYGPHEMGKGLQFYLNAANYLAGRPQGVERCRLRSKMPQEQVRGSVLW